MSRRSWSWCWAVALLWCLGPPVTAHSRTFKIDYSHRHCVRQLGQGWEKKSPDGRFKLHLTMKQGGPSMPLVYDLMLLRGTKPVWNVVFKDLVAEPYTWLSPDGRYVVLMRPDAQLVAVDAAGQMRRGWEVREHLSPAEKERLPKDLCQDVRWSHNARFIGNTFELQVPPTQVLGDSREPFKSSVLRLDLKAERLEREDIALNGEDAELIQDFTKTEAPEVRLRFADELLGRSQIRERLKSRELTAFWHKLLQTPELKPKVLHRLAVEAVAAYGIESEVRPLTRLPGEIQERDIAVLDVLKRRSFDDAGEYAVRLLDTRHSSEAVRRRALNMLLESPAAREIALGFALSDPSKDLRRLALHYLTQKPFTAQRFQQVLGFCEDLDPWVQSKVMNFALHTPGVVEEAQRKELLDAMRRSEQRFAVGQCPDVSLAVGLLCEKEGNRGQALDLYTRGLRGLEERKSVETAAAAHLRVDAMLQLGLEAEKRGERAEAEKYARALLADPSRRLPVCEGPPIFYGVPWITGDCLPGRWAEWGARALLKRLKSKPRGG